MHIMWIVNYVSVNLPATSFPSSTGCNDKCSSVAFNSTSLWSINLKRYHTRRHRRSISVPFQLHLKQASRTFQNPWILVPTASLTRSMRPLVTSEDRSAEQLLTFSYAPPILSSGDEDADGGRAYNSSSNVDSREQLRRDRIGSANKGRVPWNKGRRHSQETIDKIKERTKVAMLNPEVRDKLRLCGKNQSPETIAKIRESLLGFWEGKRIIKEAQDLCVREWKEVIAEAARVGAPGDEEYEWDSYRKVKEQYRLEDLRAEKKQRDALRAKQKLERSKKSVSDSHRKAISDAIRAKWLDPEYQAKVFAGMAKKDAGRREKRLASSKVVVSHTPENKVAPVKLTKTVAVVEEVSVEKKRFLPAPDVDEHFIAQVLAEEVTLQVKSDRSAAARKKGPRKVTLISRDGHSLPSHDASGTAVIRDQRTGQAGALPLERALPMERTLLEADVKTSAAVPEDLQLSSKLSTQSYKDPFVLEKVQRIQQLREGRLEVELKRKEAADRARMLIANAERAVLALEQAGNADPATLAALRETRRLLAEATRSVRASEVKPGTSLNTMTPPRSLKAMESEKPVTSSTSGDFHSRLWTEGDSIEDCPHPIPIRCGKLSSREEYQFHLDERFKSADGRSSRWAASRSDSEKEIPMEEAASPTNSHDKSNEESVYSEELHNPAAEGSSSAKNRSNEMKKKNLHRERVVAMNEDERT